MQRQFFIGLLFVLFGFSTYGAAHVPAGYLKAANSVNIPADIAYLAALSHSGVRLDDGCIQPWPWTLTLGKVTRYYPTRADAQSALLLALRQNIHPIKVGLMQLNTQQDSTTFNDSLNPEYNLRTGLQLLQKRYRTQHQWGKEISKLALRFKRSGVAGFCQANKNNLSTANQTRHRYSHIAQMVNVIASRYTIDPNLVLAVIRQESGFNSSAQSHKQAQGLMQLIPETAERFGVRNPYDPEDNIRGGVAYLHWLLRHFQGDVALTLAAYNAGEHAVEKYQGIPPYRETRQYVKSIMAHYPRTLHPVPPPLRS